MNDVTPTPGVWRRCVWSASARMIRTGLIALLAWPVSGCESFQAEKGKTHEPWDAARSEVQLRLASELLSVGSIAEAESRLGEFRKLAREESDTSRLIAAKIELAKGNFARARQIVSDISLSGSDRAEAEYLAGVALLTQKSWSEAAERFHVASGLRPGEQEYWLAEIQARLQGGDVESARALIVTQAETNGWSASLLVAMAECEELGGDRIAAAEAWARAGDSAAGRPEIRVRAGMALYRANRWQEASELLRGEVDSGGDSDLATPLRLALVDCLIETREIAAARQYLEPLIQSISRDARVSRRLAQVLALEGRALDALSVLDSALFGAPHDVPMLELAAAIAHCAGDPQRAVAYARRISAGNPGDSANPVLARLVGDESAAVSNR